MTDLQRAALRAKEIQGRLAELGGKSEYSDDERGELDKLRNDRDFPYWESSGSKGNLNEMVAS